MRIDLANVGGPRERIKFSSRDNDATCESTTDTFVTVPTRYEVPLIPSKYAGQSAVKVGDHGLLARRNELGAGWALVDRVQGPVAGDTVAREFGIFKPGMLSRWNTNLAEIGDKHVTPLSTRVVEGFIDGDDEGSWYRGFDVQMKPAGVRIDGERVPAVLEHNLSYLSTWTESN